MSRNKWESIGTKKDWKQGRKEEEKKETGIRWTLALSERTANGSKITPSLPKSSLQVRISRTHIEPVKKGSLAVSAQRTYSERIQNYTLSAKMFAGGSHFANV